MRSDRPLYTTDQTKCYDSAGNSIPCENTLQDAGSKTRVPWPNPRFTVREAVVLDHLTGLTWTRNAGYAEFPLSWTEAFDFIESMNTVRDLGFEDWRLPDRRELFSLVSHAAINPSIPEGHPFTEVFSGYYWSSTPCARLPNQAWYVHMGGGRMFKGMKHGSYMVWPVRSHATEPMLPRTGDIRHDPSDDGNPCGDLPWPRPRFSAEPHTVTDRLTGLIWTRDADLAGAPTDWESALATVATLNGRGLSGYHDWRLPNIRELESLTDTGTHSPALASALWFDNIREFYWSSTTSAYDPAYAWTLYARDGNIGVGFKSNPDFHVRAVRSETF